jgi:hypothetical protein
MPRVASGSWDLLGAGAVAVSMVLGPGIDRTYGPALVQNGRPLETAEPRAFNTGQLLQSGSTGMNSAQCRR